jgi:hypothetical protein
MTALTRETETRTARRGVFGALRVAAIAVLSAPIHLYRYTLSSLVGHACRFQPTCSAYALEALHVHGPFKGLVLATRRIARCHPISWLGGKSGFDPVPPAR